MTEITEIRENPNGEFRKNRMTKECITAIVRWNPLFTFLKEKFLAQFSSVLLRTPGFNKQDYLSSD